MWKGYDGLWHHFHRGYLCQDAGANVLWKGAVVFVEVGRDLEAAVRRLPRRWLWEDGSGRGDVWEGDGRVCT